MPPAYVPAITKRLADPHLLHCLGGGGGGGAAAAAGGAASSVAAGVSSVLILSIPDRYAVVPLNLTHRSIKANQSSDPFENF